MPVRYNIGAVRANPPDSAKITSFRFIFFFWSKMLDYIAETVLLWQK